MVKRIIKIFHQEIGGLHMAAVILASSSFISALLGLFRDRLLAGAFGAGQTLDIYYAAFKIPDFFYNVNSLSFVSVAVLIPVFLKKISSSEEEGKFFLDNIFSVFFIVIVFLSILIFFLIPYLAKVIVPGFSPEAKNQFIFFSRILLFSPFLLGLSNLLSTVTQSFNRFFIYALSPILYNCGIVFGIVFLAPHWGMTGIVLGVVIGALMHVAVQIPSIIKLGFVPRFITKINFSEAWNVVKLSLPRSFGLGLNQIVFIFITAVASLLSAGSIAVFNLSYNLQAVPLSVIGLSFSVAAFPTLSRLFADDQKKKFLVHALVSMRQIIFWSIPASILFIVLRAQIVRVILGSGHFSWRDTKLTAACLGLFALAITAQSLIIFFARAFYAAGKTSKPIIVNIISLFFVVSLSLLFLKLISVSSAIKSFFETVLRIKDVGGGEILILPFIFSLAMIFNAVFLANIFQKEFGPIWPYIKTTLFQVILASFLMGAVVYFSLNILDKIFDIRTFLGIFFQGFVSAIFGMGVWFIILTSVKNQELKEITEAVKKKLWKTETIAPGPEQV